MSYYVQQLKMPLRVTDLPQIIHQYAPPAGSVGRVSPDAILEIQGLSGTITDIQGDPDSPDAFYLAAL